MTALIIGATGGMGSALAERLAAQGRRLHLIGRDPDRTAALAGRLGAGHSIADVRDGAMLAEAVGAAGPDVSGLAYMVGSITLKPLKALGAADFTEDYALSALGAALAVKAALPALTIRRDTPASIVLVSSVAARQGFAAHASISMAKAAVEGLTLALAAELSPAVRVNAIAPSLTRTPLARRLIASEPMAQALAAMHPLQRLGTADDGAALAAFLMSDEAGWITGQIIGVDGGRSSLRTKG